MTILLGYALHMYIGYVSNMQKTMHLGLDDTDSTRKGCTTYLAALLVEKLENLGVEFIYYPSLIRLNPNVPWKTRGNGALCLRFDFDEDLEGDIKKAAVDLVEEHAELGNKGTDPGIVFFQGRDVPVELKLFAKKTETSVVTLKEATGLLRKLDGEALGFNSCRGIIGALAAVGETLEKDYTYELIAYRTAENRGTKRMVELDSVFEMDKQTQPYTFNSVDYEKHRLIITPRSPDPILFGIRGETAEIVKKAFAMVKSLEPVERWMIFRSNQGTDMHLSRVSALSQAKPYQSIIAKGVVSRNPAVVPVRHVIFSLQDSTAEVDCAVYEPSGKLRDVARKLVVGDEVEVYGAIRMQKDKPVTVNVEKIDVLKMVPNVVYRNPFCKSCGKRAESMGKGQGFRCKKCGAKFGFDEREKNVTERQVTLGLHFAASGSQRHLTKPLRRYGLEKTTCKSIGMIPDWHS